MRTWDLNKLKRIIRCAQHVVVDCLRQRGSFWRSRRLAGRSITVSPSEQTISQLRKLPRYSKAASPRRPSPCFVAFWSQNPNLSDAHNLLGVVLDQTGKTAEAEREYQAAIRLNPRGVSALANLGVLFARTNRSDEAIKTFAAVLRLAPDHPQATLNMGLQLSQRGDDAKALAAIATCCRARSRQLRGSLSSGVDPL